MIKSIEQFITKVIALRQKWFADDPYPDIWYRGVGSAKYNLQPGAYWRKDCDEYSAAVTYKALAPLLIPNSPRDDWEWYYLMQHYGVPTRLLDWTESPLQALQFALNSSQDGEDPIVWMLDPVSLNFSTQRQKFIFVPHAFGINSDYDAWLPHKCCKNGIIIREFNNNLISNEFPIAIYPSRTNPRLFAQRGTFTVHGTNPISLDKLKTKKDFQSIRLTKFVISSTERIKLINNLFALGFNNSSTFPEPSSVADDIKKMYGIN